MSDTLYDRDFYSWALAQAAKLRARSPDIDWEHVAEEIEALSRTEARELRSRYAVLLLHLLKWLFQPERPSPSWETRIRRERREILDHLLDNPGLKSRRDALFAEAYLRARLEAALETGLSEEDFPPTNPFTEAQAMDSSFWPEPGR